MTIPKGLPPGYDPYSHSGQLHNFHKPNFFSRKERIQRTLLAIVLIGYGLVGVCIDDLYIPGKRSNGMHLHGASAWIMYAAMLCGAAVLLSVVIDHYDKRNNEHHYMRFQKYTKIAAWSLFGVALLNAIFHWLK